MADIRRNQGRLQEAHERSKMVTRSDEMKKLREQMQVGSGGVVDAAVWVMGWLSTAEKREKLQQQLVHVPGQACCEGKCVNVLLARIHAVAVGSRVTGRLQKLWGWLLVCGD